ncbi:CAP domain-containing protein [Geminicoccus flavidas]|uniref:CAP domain-containing protein n=1 Tax=Geminicoccus flavidas TaxID=2506407 RepID=UPI00135A13AA|nr:CAP domain-containing protein [Geminicoccus flavidas]
MIRNTLWLLTEQPQRWRPVATMAIALLLLGAAPVLAADPDNLPALREQALVAANADRDEHGLAPLELTEPLNQAAQAHARDMLARNYFAHESPDGRNVQDRYREHGGPEGRVVAENLAQCTGCPAEIDAARIEALQEGWMNSPGHRENLLTPELDQFGYGIAVEGDRLVAVQTFSGPSRSPGQAEGQPARPVSQDEAGALVLELVNAARGQRGLPELAASDVLDAVAGAVLPEPGVESAMPADDLGTALPAEERERWAALALSSAGCSGCGAKLDAADADWFSRQWLDGAETGQVLLSPDMTHLGFAAKANGSGGKSAVTVLGRLRTDR